MLCHYFKSHLVTASSFLVVADESMTHVHLVNILSLYVIADESITHAHFVTTSSRVGALQIELATKKMKSTSLATPIPKRPRNDGRARRST